MRTEHIYTEAELDEFKNLAEVGINLRSYNIESISFAEAVAHKYPEIKMRIEHLKRLRAEIYIEECQLQEILGGKIYELLGPDWDM